ncbi:hypothetical protein F2A37_16710 [Pseudomonas chlororaphis]|uniref:hypothetical protein n=1 Tax=Pseudomonas chlororaphis TaxID=587753 RepID=UPI000F56F469|nr:hypothetical protein [Pseudomonas chlororaphis]AZD86571.1 Phage protein [Pseudomonas chlororaphis subsp. aureofaciens]KAA5842306.1 hypothetical protein F2A37_16710 [Pseudomonas chlororaphis]WDG45718.1 hypothetical protein PUP58_18310 [Pseudomonas chlororaphis]
MSDIQNWIKRSNRKAAKLIKSSLGAHDIVYFDKGKVRVGTLQDGMYCRYGISCRGAMVSADPMSLWQSGPGACTREDVQIMTDYLNGTSSLQDFDFGSIKDLKW